MSKVRFGLGGAIAVIVVAAAMLAGPAPISSTDAALEVCWDTKPTERMFARRMNAARMRAGKSKLRLDDELSRAARKHTWEMIGRDNLYHTPQDVLARRVTRWTILGENVGVGGTVRSLHRAFMDSPGHRANILYTSFRHVGVGVARDEYDRMWVTVIFEARTDPGTTLAMPGC